MMEESRFHNDPSWFEPLASSYMGSSGYYIPFDYDSIMMTSNKHKTMFQVPEDVGETGQRFMLSAGDVAMLNDIYGCIPTGKKSKREFKLDAAREQYLRATSAEHFAQNLKDLEKAEKYSPRVA